MLSMHIPAGRFPKCQSLIIRQSSISSAHVSQQRSQCGKSGWSHGNLTTYLKLGQCGHVHRSYPVLKEKKMMTTLTNEVI